MNDHHVKSLDSSERMRVLVTGGTSGLGLALVHAFHERGADIAFIARTRDRVDDLARRLPGTLGIPGDRLRTVSYGKEFPFDPGHDEAAWFKNRRAHFVITAK